MAGSDIIERHASSVGATPVVIDFGTAVQKIYISTYTADVNVEFNGSANVDSFRIASAQPFPTSFEFPGSQVRTVSLMGNGGTANVYVIGVVT